MSENTALSAKLYPHPFSREYWKQAASELKKTKVLIFAALMIALRVALKPLGIPIAADLKINNLRVPAARLTTVLAGG